jgi:hypothetical protein
LRNTYYGTVSKVEHARIAAALVSKAGAEQ